jgi:alpha-N-arabinofuranosidase
VKKHNEFANAVRQVDSTIELVAVGNIGDWDKIMLANSSDKMDYISEHIYRQDWHGGGIMTHTKQLADDIRNIGEIHRRYRDEISALKGKNIRIVMDEWNYWYGPHVFGELGTRYFWKDGLGIAAGLHEFYRNSDIYFMANYAQTVNVIGCIKATGIAAAFETTGLVLKMYRQFFGEIPVGISGTPEPLDAVAAFTNDRKYLTIALMNPTRKAQSLKCSIPGLSYNQTIEHLFIQNKDEMIYNDPSKGSPVTINQSKVNGFKNVKLVPLSVNIFRLKVSN